MEPEDVFLEFNGAATFTFRDDAGSLMLAHFCDDDAGTSRYFVAPTDERLLTRLRAGDLSIRGALDQPLAWIIDVNARGEVQQVWVASIEDLPPDALPQPDVMLRPSLDPLIRLRAVGAQIRPGTLPTSAVRQLVTSVEQATGTLVNFVFNRQGRAGRLPDNLRDYYVLHAQQFAFNSFEVGFRVPSREDTSEDIASVFAQVERMLVRGLEWTTQEQDPAPSSDPAESEAILRAIADLAPRRGGPTERIEVSGRVIRHASRPIVLSRGTRARATRTLHADPSHEPPFATARGRIRELDQDRLTFILRDRDDLPAAPDLTFIFDPEFLDDALDAFNEGYRVRVGGQVSHPQGMIDLLFILPGETEALQPVQSEQGPS
jgi:hypothetical protein